MHLTLSLREQEKEQEQEQGSQESQPFAAAALELLTCPLLAYPLLQRQSHQESLPQKGRKGSHQQQQEECLEQTSQHQRRGQPKEHDLACHLVQVRCTVALNLMAALYKLRKFLSLVEKSPVLGLPTVLTVGTLALSACNLCMVAEQALFSLPQLRRYMGAPLVSAAADAEEREPVYPRFGATIRRHLFFLLILLLGHWGSTTYESTLLRHAYLASQMVVLGLLFSTYNEGLLMEHQAASGSSDVRAQARAPPSGNGKAGSGADATDHPSEPSAAKKGSPRSSAVRAWLGVSPLWAWGTIAAATYSAGRVQVSASSSQLTASVRQK